jgi:RNA polymerase-binding transcription factor DksA
VQKHVSLIKRTVGKPDGTNSATEEVANILGRAPAATVPARRIPAKWRWHHRVLLALQSRLMRERRELLRASAQPVEPHSMDEADSATDEFDHDLALTQLSAEQDALYEVNGALQRIVKGTYGTCEETGQTILAARLRAVPWTRFTREVQERLEKMDVVSRARSNKAASMRGNEQIMLAPEGESEEAAEQAPAPPNDESLSQVLSPPGRRVSVRKNSK